MRHLAGLTGLLGTTLMAADCRFGSFSFNSPITILKWTAMPFSELLQCFEFRLLVHQVLDGLDIEESYRRGIKAHRESCQPCSNFHDHMLQVVSVVPEVLPPSEYSAANQSYLWNRILDSVGLPSSAVGLAVNPALLQARGMPKYDALSEIGNDGVLADTAHLSSEAPLQLNQRELDAVFDAPPHSKLDDSPIVNDVNDVKDVKDVSPTGAAHNPAQAQNALAGSLPIASIGRLDVSKLNKDADESSGLIRDLSKFLLGPDESKLHLLIDREQAHVRVNRLRHGSYEALLQMQDYISGTAAVAGTMVLAPDGSIIFKRFAANHRDDADDALSVWANVAYHNAQAACQVLGHSRVTQLISRTESGFVIVAKVQDLILLVLVDGSEDDAYQVVARIRSLG
jgi:predicted regulator of Ras-like GTPase activity (Roadblock/LC7/MglB family)